MILDSLENSGLYESIHPRFKQAFDFLRSNDLVALPLGKIELDGKNLFINVVDAAGKTVETAKMETHNKYIDIQIPVTGVETMGWVAGSELKSVTDPYNTEKDVSFFSDGASNFIAVKPFQFAIFFPTDGHQPQLFDGVVKKLIVKVLV
jgi:uncharacterized protein, YhcH/YjgK/YiaL family